MTPADADFAAAAAPAPPAPPPPPPADHPAAAPASDERVFQRCDWTRVMPYTKQEYAKRVLWTLVRKTIFRMIPRQLIGWRERILRTFGAKIGEMTVVSPGCTVFHPWLLEIGDWSHLGEGVVVYNLGPITIGSHTVLSEGAYLCAGTHDHSQRHLPLQRPPIRIGDGCWIAVQAFVCPGVTIGDNVVVGARAVVTKDVPSNVIVGGNPAKVLKPREMKWTGPPTGPLSGGEASRADTTSD